MSDLQKQETIQSLSQKRGVTWASGIFTALSFAFFGLSSYIVFVRQNGRFSLADTVMMSLTVLMFVTSLASLMLARKNRGNLSAGIIIGVSLVPPIIATLMIKGFALISIAFIVMLASILIFQVLPKTFRRAAVIATVAAIIITVGIEIWNPVFREHSSIASNFVAVSIALVVVALLAFSVRWAWSGNLRSQLIVSFLMVAIIPLVVTVTVVSYRSFSTQTPIALETQSQIAKRVAEQVKNFIFEREQELHSLVNVGDLGNVSLEEQTTLLKNLLSTQSLYDELILVNKYGREVSYVSRLNVVAPGELGNRTGQNEFEDPKTTGQTYYGPVAFNEVNGQPYQIISIPINNLRTGQLAYVLIANFRFKTVWDLMAQADVAGSGSVYMIDDQNRVVAHANPSIALQQKKVTLPAENSFTTGLSGDQQVAMARENIVLNKQTFSVIAEQPSSEALALPINNLIISIIITLGMALLAAFVGVAIANFITNPIGKLSEAAQAISQGDYSQQVVVNRQNEIGTLATAFNSMTAQLSELIGSLEQRVAARTKDLATVAEVGTATATILDTNKLLQEVVDLTKERFNLYHSHIYLLDEAGENLVLAAGAGEPGRIMVAEKRSIPLNREQSLVARAARERKGVTVNDVTQAPDFLPNPLLPDTRSELAVPMIAGGNVIGVFDIQSDQVGRFTDSDINIQTTLAAQVSTSIQNVRSFEQSKSQADFASLVNAIGQKIQRAATVEDTLQTAIRELGSALGATRVSANIGTSHQNAGDDASRN